MSTRELAISKGTYTMIPCIYYVTTNSYKGLIMIKPCVASSERNLLRYERSQKDHGIRNSNPRQVGYGKEKYVWQFGSTTTKLSGFVTTPFQWQMYEWLFQYVPLRYLCIFKHVLPETEDAWQDMFSYLRRHRSRYFNGKRRSVNRNNAVCLLNADE